MAILAMSVGGAVGAGIGAARSKDVYVLNP